MVEGLNTFLRTCRVHVYLKTTDGTLMVGSKLGLFEGRKSNGHYTFTKIALVGTRFITSISEDKQGRLWFLTYEGLLHYDKKNNLVLVFKKDDGLPSSERFRQRFSLYSRWYDDFRQR
jgi:ligand-binding sensor domain-containing protein